MLEVEKMHPKKSVGLELRTLVNLIKRQVHQTSDTISKEKNHLTPMHGWAIGYLYENQDKDVFQKDFEKEFSIRRSTASRILTSMENHGLIARESVHYDTRLKKIVLTEEAIRIHSVIMDQMAKFEQKLIQGIPEEKLEIFFEVVDEMKHNMES